MLVSEEIPTMAAAKHPFFKDPRPFYRTMKGRKGAKKAEGRERQGESNMYVANVSWLANTSSADNMQSGEKKTTKLNDGDSLPTALHYNR